MRSSHSFGLLALLATIFGSNAQVAHEFFVQSGEHFNDVVANTDGTGKVERNTVLMMQEISCPGQVNVFGLPAPHNLQFLIYEKELSMDNLWWKSNPAIDDLKKRYSNGDCNEVLFFKKGTYLQDKPVRWNPEVEELDEWCWDMVKIEVVLVNKYKETLSIQQRWLEHSPVNPKFEWLYPDETITLETYPGYHVIFYKSAKGAARSGLPGGTIQRTADEMIYGFLVKDQKRITIDEFTPMPNWDNVIAIDNEKATYRREWLFSNNMRTLLNTKQPLFVSSFTENGFAINNIPASVLDNLHTFYKDERPKRIDEPIYPNEMHVINKDEEKPGLIEVPRDVVERIANSLDDHLEKFCGCKLEYAGAYGIHEFYNGHVIRRHLTNMATNVISAYLILEETRDEDTEPWEMEVTTMDGTRRKMTLKPGQMMLWESAKIIHGFPQQYQGKRIATFMINFRPTAGWNYYIDGEYLVNGRSGEMEHIYATETEFLDKSRKTRMKDEL